MKTLVYLIRHSKAKKNEIDILDDSNVSQMKNEKIPLSNEGEKEAERISKLSKLQNVNVIYSSNYVRAISTAKYIAKENKLDLNIDFNFNERKLGNLRELEELGKTKKYKYTTEQIMDEKLKNIDGENRSEVTDRFFKSFDKILNDNQGKKIVIVSHGATIKFALLKWCKFNIDIRTLEYKGKEIAKEKLNTPEIFELVFDGKDIVDINDLNKKLNAQK